MKTGNMKLTQGMDGGGRGKQKQIYIKPDLESKASEYCKSNNVSFSYFVKEAITEYLDKRGVTVE